MGTSSTARNSWSARRDSPKLGATKTEGVLMGVAGSACGRTRLTGTMCKGLTPGGSCCGVATPVRMLRR